MGDYIQAGVDKKLQEIADKIKLDFVLILDKLLAVIEVGIIIVIVYYCVNYMFLGKSETTQKITMFYFFLLLSKVFHVLIKT